MAVSRIRRIEERSAMRTFIIAVAGIVILLGIFLIFGVNILIGFSIMLDKMRGNGPTPTPTPTIILPPTINPLPEATNSAYLPVHGMANASYSVTLIVNDVPFKTVKAATDGAFLVTNVKFRKGTNTIRATQTDSKGTVSPPSEDTTISIIEDKPTIDITTPTDGQSYSGDTNKATIAGKTDETNTVTVNDRRIIVSTGGTFSYDYPLSEGDTTLHIVATDQAGNQTTLDRKVHYSK